MLVVSAAACKPRQPKVNTDARLRRRRRRRSHTAPATKPLPPPPPPPPAIAVEDTARRASHRGCRGVEVARRPESRFAAEAGLLPADSPTSTTRARLIVSANADVLKKYPTWMITVEGHADERGTRGIQPRLSASKRANAVKTYLVSLGVSPDRLQDHQLRQGVPVRSGS